MNFWHGISVAAGERTDSTAAFVPLSGLFIGNFSTCRNQPASEKVCQIREQARSYNGFFV
jgi:hypothetical protein